MLNSVAFFFSNKGTLRKLYFYGSYIHLAEILKYLGVTFKPHVKEITDNSQISIWSCMCIFKVKWDLFPKIIQLDLQPWWSYPEAIYKNVGESWQISLSRYYRDIVNSAHCDHERPVASIKLKNGKTLFHSRFNSTHMC